MSPIVAMALVVASSTRTATRPAGARAVSTRFDARFVKLVLLRRRVHARAGAERQETLSVRPASQAVDGPRIKLGADIGSRAQPGGFAAGGAELMRLLAYVEPDGGVRGGGRPPATVKR
jgi:hypothetical protein